MIARKAACHIHTHHSYDSMTSPQAIVEVAIKLRIDYLLICDHDSWAGSIDAENYTQKKNYTLKIPFAAEVCTDIGDVIVVSESATFPLIKDHQELYRAVKDVGGYTILPHPFDGHLLEKIDFDCIDVIETFNSRSRPENNQKASELVKNLKKPFVYGSDAHFLQHVPFVTFTFEGTPPYFRNACPVTLSYTSQQAKKFTQCIKGLKTRDLMLTLRSFKRWLFT